MSQIVMFWGKCSLSDAVATGTKTMPTDMTAIGVVKDKSTTLESSEGEELKAVATGGVTVASEKLEGGFVLKARIIEPSEDFYIRYGLGSKEEEGDLNVKTHVVQGYRALKVTPKNVGAVGINAPNCTVSLTFGASEEEGYYVDVTYNILPILNDDFDVEHWYSLFRKKA